MRKFKDFLLNENNARLGKRVGDVLNAVHDLQDDIDNISIRHLKRTAENIVNQIRRILHSQWSSEEVKHLKRLQAIGVAIMKTLEEKGDVRQILSQVSSELERLSKKLGVKINEIKPPEEAGNPTNDMKLTSDQDKDMSKKKNPQEMPQDPNQGMGLDIPDQGITPVPNQGQPMPMGNPNLPMI